MHHSLRRLPPRPLVTLLAAVLGLVLLLPAVRGGEGGGLSGIRQRGRLIVGNKQAFPTFNQLDPITGRNEGFLADLARAASRDLLGDENKVAFVVTTDEDRFVKLARGDVDVLIDTIPTSAEKEKVADHSAETFRSGSALLVRKGGPIHGLADLHAGTRIAYVKANEDIAVLKARVPDAVYLEHESSAEALKTLQAGRADAFTQVVTHLFRAASQNREYTVVGRFTDKPYYMFVRKGDTALLDRLNHGLQALRESGEYDRLYQKWFGAYGGSAVR